MKKALFGIAVFLMFGTGSYGQKKATYLTDVSSYRFDRFSGYPVSVQSIAGFGDQKGHLEIRISIKVNGKEVGVFGRDDEAKLNGYFLTQKGDNGLYIGDFESTETLDITFDFWEDDKGDPYMYDGSILGMGGDDELSDIKSKVSITTKDQKAGDLHFRIIQPDVMLMGNNLEGGILKYLVSGDEISEIPAPFKDKILAIKTIPNAPEYELHFFEDYSFKGKKEIFRGKKDVKCIGVDWERAVSSVKLISKK